VRTKVRGPSSVDGRSFAEDFAARFVLWPAGMAVEIRGSHGDLLHEVVRVGLAGQVAGLGEQSLPLFVTREFEGYLGCV
jgi:hypothetical protein